MFIRTIDALAKNNDILVWGYSLGGETEEEIRGGGYKTLIGMNCIDEIYAFKPQIINFHRLGYNDEYDVKVLQLLKKTGGKIIETSVFGRPILYKEELVDLSLQISKWDLFRWNRLKRKYNSLGIYSPYIVDTNKFKPVERVMINTWRKQMHIPENAFIIGRAGKTCWEWMAEPILKVLTENKNVWLVSVEDYNTPPPKKLVNHSQFKIISRLYTEEELSTFYSSCTVCLSASPIGESFGMYVAESMACGTPVVALSTPQADNAQLEVICNRKGGVLFANPWNIVDVVQTLLSEPNLIDSMKSQSRNIILSNYSPEKVNADLINIFNIVHQAENKKILKEKLKSDGYITEIHFLEILKSIFNVYGKYPIRAMLGTFVNLSPFFQKIYFALKRNDR